MRWSKLRKSVEESLAPSVRGRVRLFSTHYACSCGYGAIVVDGQQVAEFNTLLHFRDVDWVSDDDRPGWLRKVPTPATTAERHAYPLCAPREFCRGDLHDACWRLLHMNPHAALGESDPLLVTLAVLHHKVGVGRLRLLRYQEIHPLVRWAVEFRLEAEAKAKRLASGF